MNYCRFRNEFIKRMANATGGLLPAEYQQVEWIKSNNASSSYYGADWIHIDTGINYFADFDIECNKTVNTGAVFFGCGDTSYGKTVGRYSSSSPYFTFFATASDYYMTNIPITTRTKVTWIKDKIYVDDVLVTTKTKPTSSKEFKLFGYISNAPYYYNNIQMYYCILYDDNGDEIRHYIPCYRKADNVPGMFDLVTSTFNPGTGTSGYFTVGQDV